MHQQQPLTTAAHLIEHRRHPTSLKSSTEPTHPDAFAIEDGCRAGDRSRHRVQPARPDHLGLAPHSPGPKPKPKPAARLAGRAPASPLCHLLLCHGTAQLPVPAAARARLPRPAPAASALSPQTERRPRAAGARKRKVLGAGRFSVFAGVFSWRNRLVKHHDQVVPRRHLTRHLSQQCGLSGHHGLSQGTALPPHPIHHPDTTRAHCVCRLPCVARRVADQLHLRAS